MTRILLTGGGTGGHVYPALAVAEALAGCEVHFAGTPAGIERRLATAAGLVFHPVPASGFRGLGLLSRLRFVANFARGTGAALGLLGRWRPDVVLGTGGYVTGPVMAAARLRRIPCALQEQNAVPGSANRLASRWARRIYLGEDAARRWLPQDRCVTTGNPVRRAFLQDQSTLPGLPQPAPGGLRILVFGGSGGAQTLSRTLSELAPAWRAREDLVLVVQTGPAAHAEVAAAFGGWSPERVLVTPYIDAMAPVLRWADLVVCRAGAMTLAELAVCGRPAVLVPFPHATDDHQLRNARAREAAGAAMVIEDRDCRAETLAAAVEALAADRPRLAAMAAATAGLARPDAAATIAADVLRLARGEPVP